MHPFARPSKVRGIPIALPNCQRNTAAWLDHSDKLTAIRFDPDFPVEDDFFIHPRSMPPLPPCPEQSLLRQTQASRRLEATSDLMVSRTASGLFLQEDFEAKWLALATSEQEAHILESFRALDKIHERGPRGDSFWGEEKLNCPELMRSELMKNGGRGYLDLVRTAILEVDELPRVDNFVENDRFKELIGYKEDEPNDSMRLLWYQRRLARSRYIRKFIMCSMACWMKEETTVARYTPNRGEDKAEQRRTDYSRPKNRVFCENCLKHERKDESGKMNMCAKCKSVGREVRYCNRQCQKEAWPKHKRYCGQELDMSVLTEEIPPVSHGFRPRARIDIPLIANGRLPGLLAQVNLLYENPLVDFFLIQPVRDEARQYQRPIIIEELTRAAAFIVMRNRAMRRADEPALFFLYRFLEQYVDVKDVAARKALNVQLEREHGTHFTKLQQKLRANTAPTIEELSGVDIGRALEFLHSAGRFKAELRDYAFDADAKTQRVSITIGLQKGLAVWLNIPESVLPRVDIDFT